MIDINKKYTTRDGGEVTLYTTNGKNKAYPVVGEVVYEGGSCVVLRWDKDGNCHTSASNLVEVPIWEPSPELVAVLRPGWIACDTSSHQWWWYTKKPRRIAGGDWACGGDEVYRLELISETLLPPINEQTTSVAFKIGNPKEKQND